MYSIAEVARANGIARHQVRYLLQKGVLQEPRRLNGHRCFTLADLEAVRRHLQTKKKT